MKHALVVAMILAASPAAAQPGAGPNCEVTIVRAPDDVRNMVESWVRAEPNCNSRLEVRIVPTPGGYYLLARDDYGRTRERVVPDAQSAGVLVASWVATDSSDGSTPFDVRHPPPATPAPLRSEASMAPGEGAPGMVTPAIAQPVSGKQARWFSVGAVMGEMGGGLRGELDWRAGRLTTLGLAASVSTSQLSTGSSSLMGQVDIFDGKLLGYLSIGTQWGKWRLRTQIGAGFVYTNATLDGAYAREVAKGLLPTGELAATLSRDLGSTWAIAAGPVISLYLQEYRISEPPNYSYVSRELEPMFFIAGRYRL